MSKRKPILCLDFDGVVHSYASGWKGARTIPDDPTPGAIEFIGEALSLGWDVVIHSSRARYFGGISAMRAWLCYDRAGKGDMPLHVTLAQIKQLCKHPKDMTWKPSGTELYRGHPLVVTEEP